MIVGKLKRSAAAPLDASATVATDLGAREGGPSSCGTHRDSTRHGSGSLARCGRGMATIALLGGVLFGSASCRSQGRNQIPNRVLDRPIDVALLCTRTVCDDATGRCDVEPLGLGDCNGETFGSCTDEDSPNMVGFVTNSERNEIAMFRRCDGRLVDMDPSSPGYSFIPAGILPAGIVTLQGGCRVVAANSGSCDLTVLNGPGLAAYAFGQEDRDDESEVDPQPGALVSRLIPERFDANLGWVPVATRIGDIIPVPTGLSQSQSLGGGGGGSTLFCGPDVPGSVYLSLPSCNAVVEVDLLTSHILQAFQMSVDADGEVSVVSTGSTLECPVDCPSQVDDLGVVPPDPLPDFARFGPSGIELVTVPSELSLDPADQAMRSRDPGPALYVGGLLSDRLLEIRMDDDGVWRDDVNQLRLVDALSIERIRATPPMFLSQIGAGSDIWQFLYVIAGDGSTRVVARFFERERTEIGQECDTQVDPSLGVNQVCYPVTDEPGGEQPVDRRPLATGPGIRTNDGSRVTDWAFQRVDDIAENADVGTFGGPGQVVGIATTNGGRIGLSGFGQYANFDGDVGSDDPVGLLDAQLGPHMFLATNDPRSNNAGWPLLADAEAERRVPQEGDALDLLSPGLRQVDFAYASGEDATSAAALASTLLGGITNVDLMGSASAGETGGFGIYSEDVARVVVRDYRAWTAGVWSLNWEGDIPGTTSISGLLSCPYDPANPDGDKVGWEETTCLATEPGDSKLIDLSADFCADGVLAGDKVVLVGCDEDSDCGPGQRCLISPLATSTGVCVSADAFANDPELAEVCSHFIEDTCGDARREYLITKAFPGELWLQAMDRPLEAFVREVGEPVCTDVTVDGKVVEVCTRQLEEDEERLVCTKDQPEGGCVSHEECQILLEGTEDDPGGAEFLCIDQRCKRACNSPDECTLRRLPGPRCFREFVSYQVRARNSFIVRGTGAADFLEDQVAVDPDTGECTLTGNTTNVSTLLTSRIPLGPDDDNLGLPNCATDDSVPTSGDINPCRVNLPRGTGDSLFHTMNYRGAGPVSVVRFANPILVLALDLVDLGSLTAPIAGSVDSYWPESFRQFRRSRIPPGYREQFSIAQSLGYDPLLDGLTLSGASLVYPVRVVNAPELGYVFVVDASGIGTVSGVRGQVMRVNIADPTGIFPDASFDKVR